MTPSDSRPVRLAVFGSFSDHDLYQRNRQLVAHLRAMYPDNVVINTQRATNSHGFAVSLGLFQRFRQLVSDLWNLWRARRNLDGAGIVFVPYPAYLPLLVLRLSGRARRARVIADAFIELQSTVVEDRRLLPSASLRSRWLLAFQRLTLGSADVLLMDTASHAVLLRQRLGVGAPPACAVPVAIDETLWPPLPPVQIRDQHLRVLFWGTFIPLHGVETIIRAAEILRDRGSSVDFQLIGDGPEAVAVARLQQELDLRNISWTRELVESPALKAAAAEAQVVLGVFGSSAKAGMVVPYKVHQALALNRIVITRRSDSFPDDALAEEGLLTVPPADAAALAQALLEVQRRLTAGWSPAPRDIYERRFSATVVREALHEALQS